MNLGSLLNQLVSAQLIKQVREGESVFLFQHALTQEATYMSLLNKTRREIHQRVAESCEQLYFDHLDEYVELLSFHYFEAHNDHKAVEYSTKAAIADARVFAFVEASLYYARVLESLRRLPDTEELRAQRVDAINNYIELSWGATVPQEHFALSAEAEALALTLPNPDGSPGDARRLERVHGMRAALHLAHSEYREATQFARQGLVEARALDDPTLLITPSAQLGAVLVLQGHFADEAPYLAEAIALSENNPNRWEWAWSVGFNAISLAMRGQVTAGMAETHRALTRMQANNSDVGITQSRADILPVLLEVGNMPELLAESQRTIGAASKTSSLLFTAIGLGFQAVAFSRLGRHQDAQGAMAASYAAAARTGGQPMMWDWLAAATAEVAFNAGNLQEALVLAEQASANAQSCGSLFADGWAHRIWAEALAGQENPLWDRAEEHLTASLNAFEQGDSRIEAAHTHAVWGRICRSRGDIQNAREHEARANAVVIL